MNINIYSIGREAYKNIQDEFILSLKQFGVELNIIDIWNNKIVKAHKMGITESQNIYHDIFKKFIKTNNVILTPSAKTLDSFGFTDLLRDKSEINFFIGGAYGFNAEMLQCGRNLSLSALTFSHRIAKIVLCEQIFRAHSILNNHPYHK